MSAGKLATSVLAGAAAGAILGVLFAPDKGSETRKKIAQKGSDLSSAVKDRFSKAGEAISEKYQSIKDDARNIMDQENPRTSGSSSSTSNKGGSKSQPAF